MELSIILTLLISGNMAAGSPTAFLPSLLTEIEKAAKDDRKLHLLLGSVKEVLSHTSSAALADLSSALWGPLFQICDSASAQQKAGASNGMGGSSAKAGDEARLDGTRNIAAECLGKITLTNPATHLGQLQSRMQATSAGTRAAVITAIRFTFSDASSAYDDLLAPLIVQFLSLMHDPDLVRKSLYGRRLSLIHTFAGRPAPSGLCANFSGAQQASAYSRSFSAAAGSAVHSDKN